MSGGIIPDTQNLRFRTLRNSILKIVGMKSHDKAEGAKVISMDFVV